MSYFGKEKASSGFLTSIQGNSPSHVEATLVYQKTLKQPCSGAQQSPRFPLSSRSGYRDIRWEPYSGHYCGRYSRKFPQHKQDEISIWDYPSEWLGSPGGDFPLATFGFPPRGAFLMPIKLSKNRGQQSVQNPPPDICILTLAMMIAGIPTVPVPGIKEEDLIRAAQNFMAENPEQGVQGERTPERTGNAQFWKTDRQRKRPVDRGFQPPSIAHFEK
uniref:Spermatosis associated 25 n=1 Tax=Chrysemys picta bellii TaxID=8478 RepID=A0A8C3IXS9_CHRPI